MRMGKVHQMRRAVSRATSDTRAQTSGRPELYNEEARRRAHIREADGRGATVADDGAADAGLAAEATAVEVVLEHVFPQALVPPAFAFSWQHHLCQ